MTSFCKGLNGCTYVRSDDLNEVRRQLLRAGFDIRSGNEGWRHKATGRPTAIFFVGERSESSALIAHEEG